MVSALGAGFDPCDPCAVYSALLDAGGWPRHPAARCLGMEVWLGACQPQRHCGGDCCVHVCHVEGSQRAQAEANRVAGNTALGWKDQESPLVTSELEVLSHLLIIISDLK